jgi:hypothetical protein
MSCNLYLFRKGKKADIEVFLATETAYRYAMNYAEEYTPEEAYVQIRKLNDDYDPLIGRLIYDSRKQTIVDNYGHYEVIDK